MRAKNNTILVGLLRHWWLIHSFRHDGVGLPKSKDKSLVVFLFVTLSISIAAQVFGYLFAPSIDNMPLSQALVIGGFFQVPMLAGFHLLKAQEAFVLMWTYLELAFSGTLGLLLILIDCPSLCAATLILAAWSLVSFVLFNPR